MVTFVNSTSQDAAAAFTHFGYEALLAQITGKSSFSFQLYNAPFPVSQELKDQETAANGVFLAFVWSIALGLVPTGMVSYVVAEKERNLKH